MKAIIAEDKDGGGDGDGDDGTPTSDEEQASLSPKTLGRFLSKLEVRVLPSLPRPPSTRSASVVAGQVKPYSHHTAEEQQQQQQLLPDEHASESRSADNGHDCNSSAATERREEADGSVEVISSFFSARQMFEERGRRKTLEDNQRSFRGRRPVTSGSSPPSCPPIAQAAATGPKAADRYLQDISRDNASVHCRLQFYNQELARMGGEAQALVARVAPPPRERSRPMELSASLAPPPPPLAETNVADNDDHDRAPRMSPDMAAHRSSPQSSPRCVETSSGRDAGGNGLVVSIAAGVGGRTAILRGGSGGGGAVNSSPTRTAVAFSRISPVEKADPSHPRVELTPRSRSSPSPQPPFTGGGQAQQQPGRIEGATTPSSGGGGIAGGDQKSPTTSAAGMSHPRNSGGDDATRVTAAAAPSDLVSKLLVSALKGTREKNITSTSQAVPSPEKASEERSKIATVPKADRFDPPSIRNGLTGMNMGDVDDALLKVEDSVPGAVSSWKMPLGRGHNNGGIGATRTRRRVALPSTSGDRPGEIKEMRHPQRRQVRQSKGGTVGWFYGQGASEGGAGGRGKGEGKGAGGDGVGAGAGQGGPRSIRAFIMGKRPQWRRANSTAARDLSPELKNT